MKKVFIKLMTMVLFAVTTFLLMNDFVDAQNYQIHEQIPGQTGRSGIINGVDYGGDGVDTLQDYLESAYKFGIAIVAILAVVMIGVGGFMYIVTSAGNAGKLANAKEIITSAILGLVMALLSWLILFVINPDLVSNTLDGVKFEYYNTTWRNDTNPDPGVCNVPKLSIYERPNCSGDYVCLQDTCRNKKSFCLPFGEEFPGVCNEKSVLVASVGNECGIAVGNSSKLSGICELGTSCSVGGSVANTGKQCVNDSVCCVSGL